MGEQEENAIMQDTKDHMRNMWRIVLVAKWRENEGKETATQSGEEAGEGSLLFCLCGISGEVASK